MPQSIIFLTYITYLFRGKDAMDFRISIDRHQQLLWWNSTGGLQTQHQDGIIWLVKPCSKKLLHHFLDGGPGWTRTNDVSKVTGLQPATLAARLLTHIMPCQIYIQPQFWQPTDADNYSSSIYNAWMFPCLSWKQSLCRHKQLIS